MSLPGVTNYPALVDDATSLIRIANLAQDVIGVGGVNSSDLVIPVGDTTQAPADGIAWVGTEAIRYVSKTGTTITADASGRGYDGTTPAAHAAGADIYFGPLTAARFNVLRDAIIALQTKIGVTSGYPTAKIGRGASLVVAASGASAMEKAQADYLCDGTADDVEINAAIAALPTGANVAGGAVRLTGGYFNLAAPILIDRDNITLVGSGWGTAASGGTGSDPVVGGTRLNVTAGFTGGSAVIIVKKSDDSRVIYGTHIRDLAIMGFSGPADIDGIHWTATWGTVTNVFITYMSGNGLYSTNDGTTGLFGHHDPYACLFDHVLIRTCTGSGMVFDKTSTDHHIVNCEIAQNGGDGLRLWDSLGASAGNMVKGCYIWSSDGTGIVANSWQTKIFNTRVQDSGTGGLYITGAAGDGGGFQIVGCNFRNNSIAATNTYDDINIAPTGAIYGGLITACDFYHDGGLDNSGLTKSRYGINVVNANMHDLTIGPCSSGRKPASENGTFATGFINDAGTNTRIVSTDRMTLYREGDMAVTYHCFSGGTPILTGSTGAGTQDAPLRTVSGETLFTVRGSGWYAADDVSAATAAPHKGVLSFQSTEAWTATGQGTKAILQTTAIGATSRATRLTIDENGLTLPDAHHIVLGTATGTKIGTSASQKLAFFGATAIVQPANTTDLRTALINLGLYATGGASPLHLNGGVLTAGTITSNGNLNVSTDTGGTVNIASFGATPNPSIAGTGARGTLGTPLRTKSGDIIARMTGTGYQAVDDVTTATAASGTRARIVMNASEDWTSTAQGTRFQFDTTPNGSTTSAERVRITDTAMTLAAGVVLLGNWLTPAGSATAGSWPKFTTGTLLTTPEAGAWEYAGDLLSFTKDTTNGRGSVSMEHRVKLDSNGSNISTIANFFGANSNLPLVANAYYEIEIEAWFTKNTAGTVTWTFTNTAAPTQMNLDYRLSAVGGIVATAAATTLFGQQHNLTSTAPTIVTGSLTNSTTHYHKIIIRLRNGTGTSLKFQVTAGAGTITPLAGSRWRARRIDDANVGAVAA